VLVSIASPLMQPSPNGRRVGIRIVTFEACSGFISLTLPPAGSLSRPRRPLSRGSGFRLPGRAARQLPDQSTILWVASSSTSDSRLQGALPFPDIGVTRNQGAAIAETMPRPRASDYAADNARDCFSLRTRSVKTPGQGAARLSSAGFQCQGRSSAICWAG
jgi:hypothetical protein